MCSIHGIGSMQSSKRKATHVTCNGEKMISFAGLSGNVSKRGDKIMIMQCVYM